MHFRGLLFVVVVAACGNKSDSKPESKPEPAAKPASGSADLAPVPAAPATPTNSAAAPAGGKKLVDLSAIKDATGTDGLINASIEVPADATVSIETRTVDGDIYSTAKIRVEGIEIDPKMAEMTAADIEVSKLPSPGTFEKVKSSFKPTDIVRAEKDADGHTFLTKVGDKFMVNVQRGTYLCGSAGADGNGLLESAATVTVDICRSLKPTK